MSPTWALFLVAAAALISNRIISVLVGLILRVPPEWMLPTVFVLDLIQIPFFYWVYENSLTSASWLPARVRSWFSRDWSATYLGRWTASLGGVGVMLVAALPTFGGGMWSAVFLAYSLRLRKRWSYGMIAMGSLISYAGIFWVLDAVVRTVRYFVR